MKNNKGISLIVLVITIIVMIILAGSVVITLSNTGIMDKAEEAVNTTNEAQIKQIAQMYYAEYKLSNTTEKADVYVKNALRNAGVAEEQLDRIIVYDDGKVIAGASKVAVALFEAGAEIGATIEGYTIDETKTYTTTGEEITKVTTVGAKESLPYDNMFTKYYSDGQTVKTAVNPTWKYMGISEDGQALIVMDLNDITVADAYASNVYSTMALGGLGGWYKGVDTLNTVCDELYTTEKGKARSINYEDLLYGLKWNGPKAQYTNESGSVVDLYTTKTIGELIAEGNSLQRAEKHLLMTYGTPEYPIFKRDAFYSEDVDNTTNIESYEVGYLNPTIRKDSNGDLVADDIDPNAPLEEQPSHAKYVKADDSVVDVVLGTLDINYWLADKCTGVNFKGTTSNNIATYYIRRANCKNISGYNMLNSYRINYSSGSSSTSKDLYVETKTHGADGKVVVRPVVELADTLSVTFDTATNKITLGNVQ